MPRKPRLDPAAEKFLRRLGDRSAESKAEPKISKRRHAFRRAAAVTPDFDPTRLRPAGARGVRGEAALDLRDDSLQAGDPSRWRLKPEVRRRALQTITSRKELLRVLRAGREAADPKLLATMTAYARRTARPLDQQSVEELAVSLQAVQQLSELTIPDLKDIPAVGDIHRALEKAYLLEPFKRLVGDHFAGREDELKKLRRYVGVLPPSSRLEAVQRQLEAWLHLAESAPPLLLYGPGGVGKSTLVAKFLLEHMELPKAIRIPFVYLDFQRPNLVVDEPRTLLAESARQLAIQYPEAGSDLEASSLDDTSTAGRVGEEAEPEARLVATLKEAIVVERSRRDSRREILPPWLMVLDSFEEVQYRSSSNLRQLWLALGRLQKLYPKLRVVVSGRSPVENIVIDGRQVKEIELGDFDSAAARGFLRRQGVTDPQVAEALFSQVRGNPLSLLLAAEVARREQLGNAGVEDLKTRKLWLFEASEAVIQGQLYRRILGHVHDSAIRKIAHPGLVLRRMSPEIIQEVLAEPCGVEVSDRQHAQQLFEELRKEAALVDLGADGFLYHLPAVRRVMLQLLEKDKPKIVRSIEQRAVGFYRSSEEPADRAEEIYHRLRLGQDLGRVDQRWLPGVAPLLERSFEELPKRAQVYLAPRLGRRVSAELRRLADLESWEELTAERARELLQTGAAEEALEALRRRPERTSGSPLWLLEARALDRLGRLEEAGEIIADGLLAAGQAGEQETRLELLLPAATIAWREGDARAAELHLAEAEQLATRLEHRDIQLTILLRRAELQEQELDDPETSASVRQRLSQLFTDLPTGVLTVQPDAVRQVVRHAGATAPSVLARAVNLVRIDLAGSSSSDRLAAELARLYTSSPTLARWLRGFTSRGERSPRNVVVARRLLDELAAQYRLEELIQRCARLGEKAAPFFAALAAVIVEAGASVQDEAP